MVNKMTTLFKLVLITVFLIAGATGHATAQTNDAALVMVKTLGLGSNLSSMSFSAAMMTQTYQGISQKIGPAKAREILKKELEKTVPKYQEQWDQNLADSYSSLLNPGEMLSLTKLKQKSPYVSKFRAVQYQAGANMQAKSKDLLTTVISEALNSAFSISMR